MNTIWLAILLAAMAGIVLYDDIWRDRPLWRVVVDRAVSLILRLRSRA